MTEKKETITLNESWKKNYIEAAKITESSRKSARAWLNKKNNNKRPQSLPTQLAHQPTSGS